MRALRRVTARILNEKPGRAVRDRVCLLLLPSTFYFLP
jgi:hypothetical protein